MVLVEDFLKILKKEKVNFFSGVPDSILKNLSIYLEDNKNHFISTSEGSAVSKAIGNYLATKKIPCIYMQNSGLSNAINPLISIAGQNVYSIPMLLVIGWRGSPNFKDEPQHEAKGKITIKLLKLLKIKYCIIKNNKDLKKLKKLLQYSKKQKKIIACLFEKNVLRIKRKISFHNSIKSSFSRHVFINELLRKIKKNTKIISTTGYTSRELFQIRKYNKYENGKDFYMVGGMGHASSVSLGYVLSKKKDKVFCLDGDGSLLMHMGSLATIGNVKPKNLIHILFNNNAHESVGGQTTNAKKIDFKKLVQSLGYKYYFKVTNLLSTRKIFKQIGRKKGPIFIEVIIKQSSLSSLERPKSLKLIKERFIK